MRRRIRVSTFLILFVILAQGMALVAQHQRHVTREARLKKELAAAKRDHQQELIQRMLLEPRPIEWPPSPTLKETLATLSKGTATPVLPKGFPVLIDPIGLQEAGAKVDMPMPPHPAGPSSLPLGQLLGQWLGPIGLDYQVSHGLFLITAAKSMDRPLSTDAENPMKPSVADK